MKILFITQTFPYPPLRGDNVISYALIKELYNRGNGIYLVSFIYSEEEEDKYLPALKKYCRLIKLAPYAPKKNLLSYILKVFNKYPYGIIQLYSKSMETLIKEVLKENRIDVIHFHGPAMAQYINAASNYPKVVVPIDCISERFYQFYKVSKNPVKKIHYFLHWKKSVKFERDYYIKFDQCVVVNIYDAKKLQEISPKLELNVIPNGVDIQYFCPKSKKSVQKECKSIVFTGAMNYYPNIDAVLFFVREIFPYIRQEIPDIKFYIVGRDPDPKIFRLTKTYDNIIVTGFVEDIRPYLLKSSVYIAPLRTGVGIKNKVLEAMATGIPIVGTSLSFSGIEVEHGKEVLIADEPKEVARLVLSLIKDKNLAETLAYQGRRFVEKNHSWESTALKYENVYKKAIKKYKS